MVSPWQLQGPFCPISAELDQAALAADSAPGRKICGIMQERVKRIPFPLGAGTWDTRRGGKGWNPAWFAPCKPTPAVCRSVCAHWDHSIPSLLLLAQGCVVKRGLCTTSAQGCLRNLNWNWILCFTDWYQREKKIPFCKQEGSSKGVLVTWLKNLPNNRKPLKVASLWLNALYSLSVHNEKFWL